MKVTITLLTTLLIGCFSTYTYGAESKPAEQVQIIVEEVPEAVREQNRLTPEELEAQEAVIQKAMSEFESATAEKNPTQR
tara:strand:+ start:15901 stop:16140 length:240 start_codon:yes stop_codon:yes gene_type:complete